MSDMHYCTACKAEHTISPEDECPCCRQSAWASVDAYLSDLKERAWETLNPDPTRAQVANHFWNAGYAAAQARADDEIKRLIDVGGNFKFEAIQAKDKLARAEAEIAEQCRLNGMGQERELALMGKLARAETVIQEMEQALKSKDEFLICYRTGQRPTAAMWKRAESVDNARAALKAYRERS